MYRRILIATDGSDLALKGLTQGLALAKALGAQVTVVTASEPFTPIGVDGAGLAVSEYALADEFDKSAAAAAKLVLDEASKIAADAGVTVETIHVPHQYPADAIVETARAGGHDLIVMSSHGRRGLGRLLLGSQANAVLTHSEVPVLVVR